MCGIAGFLSQHTIDGASVLRRMTGAIAHRGPDDSGHLVAGPVHLGHRRLSIVDLSACGHQPMANEDGAAHIVFNGEIFNHADLRPALEQAGHQYRSRSDTETILHAWEEYGPACVERFRGMFAFAIWDAKRQVLFCARDRLGIKPFYYYSGAGVFVFASEIKALLEHPAVPRDINEAALAEYLALGYLSAEDTMFRGIRCLLPGHRLELRAGASEPSIERYWDVPEAGAATERPDEDWVAECRSRLEETVRMRLMSDVPLGAFLSGGVDSSAITALMTRMVPDRVKTFSVGYHETQYSELGYAAQVARALGTDHREIVVGPDDFFGALPSLVWHEDKPICWPSSVSLYFVSKLASEEVKVVLTGEGSDEIFAGYHRYAHYLTNQRLMRVWSLAPAAARRGVRSFIAGSRLLSGDLRRKLQHTVLGRENSVEALHLDGFYSAFAAEERDRFFAPAAAGGDAASNFLRYWNARASSSTLSRLLYADQKTYLVELLMKQDRMSMATSIESRVPLLDHPLVEFAARVPDQLKLRNGTGKYIFKKAVEDLLPNEIVHRTKMGFPTPLRRWVTSRLPAGLRGELTAPGGLLREYVSTPELERLMDGHAAGAIDATDRIWRLLNLQIWGDVFFGAGRGARPAAEMSARR